MSMPDKENVLVTSQEVTNNQLDFDPEIEPLLCDNPNRFVVFPIEYPDIWKMYKTAEAAFWTTEEIDVSKDILEWNNLSKGEQQFFKNLLLTLGITAGLIEDIVEDLSKEIKVTEALCFFGLQTAVQNIHSEMFTLLIDTYITSKDVKEILFSNSDNLPYAKKILNWTQHYVTSKNVTFAERIIALAAVEGIFLNSLLTAIAGFKKLNQIPGLEEATLNITRDADVHCNFACLMYSLIVQKSKKQDVQNIIKNIVDITKNLLSEMLPVKLINLNNNDMNKYIEYVADNLLMELGYSQIFVANNPFTFTENLAAQQNDAKNKQIFVSDVSIGDDFNIDLNF